MSLGLGFKASGLNDQLEWEKQGKETKKCPDRNHQCLVLKTKKMGCSRKEEVASWAGCSAENSEEV